MRIIQINTVSGKSSTGKICADLSLLLIEKKHNAAIVYGISSARDDVKSISYKCSNKYDVKIHSLLSQLSDSQGLLSLAATRRAIRHIKDFKPDIIHLHNIHGCYLNYPMLFKFLSKYPAKIVWTLHDCWPFTGHCAYFDYVNCKKWQSQCFNCPQSKNSYPNNLYFDFSKRNFKLKKKYFLLPKQIHFVCPSKWIYDLLSQSFLKHYNRHVILNGVDTNLFKKASQESIDQIKEKLNIKNYKTLLAVANDWDARKGVEYIKLFSKRLEDNTRLIIIGNGSQNLAHKNCICLDHTDSQEELIALYSSASLLINPTLEDNMPLVNLEALSCSCPIVCFNTGGCKEIIDSSCGALVEKGNFEEFFKQAMQLIDKRESLEYNCRKRAESLSSKICYEKYIKLYEDILK